MRRKGVGFMFITTLGLLFLLGSAVSSAAQVKHVQMHIGGYLCGN